MATPCHENILGGVSITVVNISAFRTSPFSNSKACDTFRPRLVQTTTSRTGLGGVCFVDFLEQYACRNRLVLKHCGPACVQDRFRHFGLCKARRIHVTLCSGRFSHYKRRPISMTSIRARSAVWAGATCLWCQRLCQPEGTDSGQGAKGERFYERAHTPRGRSRRSQASKKSPKSKIRARVEHVFAVVKRLWGFSKVRYRGLAKNASRAFTALAVANVYLAGHRLMAPVRPCLEEYLHAYTDAVQAGPKTYLFCTAIGRSAGAPAYPTR